MNPSSTTQRHSAAAARLASSTGVSYMADGGLETTLVFLQGIDLPEFAAFPLLDDEAGRAALVAYYEPYIEIARQSRLGLVLDTPTWRANPDWARLLGYDETALREINQRAVHFIADLAAAAPIDDTVVNGVVGPRGDGYVVSDAMGAIQAATYHGVQAEAFAAAGADTITAVTMTYAEEAMGVATAASAVGMPAVIGFTVETDERLPSGQPLGEAIDIVDQATGGSPAWYMVNCAHPSHFEHVLRSDEAWINRIGAVRGNASRMSHEELDEAPELDRGDPAELADDYRRLRNALPNLRVVGGCCGTDHEHLASIADALT